MGQVQEDVTMHTVVILLVVVLGISGIIAANVLTSPDPRSVCGGMGCQMADSGAKP
jgi:hypothetical protein